MHDNDDQLLSHLDEEGQFHVGYNLLPLLFLLRRLLPPIPVLDGERKLLLLLLLPVPVLGGKYNILPIPGLLLLLLLVHGGASGRLLLPLPNLLLALHYPWPHAVLAPCSMLHASYHLAHCP